MMRASAAVTRVAAACALAVVTSLASPLAGDANPTPGELTSGCALESSGALRAVSSPSECQPNEKPVTFKPGPVVSCVQPSGSTRRVSSLSECKEPAIGITLPPVSGTVYFCATIPAGALRYVTDPASCSATEVLVEATPTDLAPRVTSTAPANGATHVSTATGVTVRFSESVSVDAGGVSMTCNSIAQPVTVSGSPGAALTIHPVGALPEGVACTVTVTAAAVSDTDLNDPPDSLATDYTFGFTTDAAPVLVASSPAENESGVPADASIVLSFSEPVDVGSRAFHLACGGQELPATVSGSGTATVTVKPDSALPASSGCTLSAAAADIGDTDGGDPPDTPSAPVALDFLTLDRAPRVVSTTPADNASRIGTTSNIAVTFSEVVNTTSSSFSLHCDGDTQQFTVGSGTSVITLDPTTDLPAGKICTVTAVAADISDVDSVDPPDHPTDDYTFSFTVDAAPAVTGTTPADGATNVEAASTVVVGFSEPVTVTRSSFTLTCGGNSLGFAVSGSGTDTVTVTPSTDLPGGTTCRVAVLAAQITDTDPGDPPDTMSADLTLGFTIADAAPSVVSSSPADGATHVSATGDIVVAFSEPVTTRAGAVSLECPGGTQVPFSLSGSPGSVITLDPTGPLPAGETCSLDITAGGVHDVDTADPPDTMDADFTASFTVSPNGAPTDLDLSPKSVDENLPAGTTVGTLTTTDPDPGDTHTYSLVSGAGDTDNGSFTIVGDQLRTKASFDYETKASYTVRIRTEDQASGVLEKSLTVTVNDANEAPTSIGLTPTSVDENQPSGTVVGTLSADDPDSGQLHSYAVVTFGCGGSFPDGAAFTVAAGDLTTTMPLDHDAKRSYAVCLRVTDDGTSPLSFDQQVTIDVNRIPPPARPRATPASN